MPSNSLSTTNAGKNGHHVQKNEVTHTQKRMKSHHTQKLTQMDHRPMYKS